MFSKALLCLVARECIIFMPGAGGFPAWKAAEMTQLLCLCSCGVSWSKHYCGKERVARCVHVEQCSQAVGERGTAAGSAEPASQMGEQQDIF